MVSKCLSSRIPAISPLSRSRLKQTIPRPVNLTSAVAEISWTDINVLLSLRLLKSFQNGETFEAQDVTRKIQTWSAPNQRHTQPSMVLRQKNLRCPGTFRALAGFPGRRALTCHR